MATATQAQQIVLEVDTVDQIFNDSDADPFSTRAEAALGEAALERVLTRLQAHPLRDWENVPLIVRLPAAQITPALQPQLAAAIHRYCTARIEENRLQVALGRKQHTFGMIAVVLIVLAVIAIAYLLFTTVLVGAGSTIEMLVVASISVFAWVILWDPLEALLFEWAPPARENKALEHLMGMPLVIEPRPEPATA